MPTDSRKDDLLGVIAVIVLLIGTATGNAYTMLCLSAAAFVLMAVFCRQRIGSGALLVAIMAAGTAAAIGIFMAVR
jgi:hypothetical protein